MAMEWYQQPNWKWREDRNSEALDFAGYCERDNQRQRCYNAEDRAGFKHLGRNFTSIEQIQQYIDDLCATAWFAKRFGTGWMIEAKDFAQGSGRWAYGCYRKDKRGYIKVPNTPWAYSEWLVLHELAHAITPSDTGGRHGRFWARAYLEMVRYRMGLKAYELLKASYKKHNVRSSPKRPATVISPQCAAARKAVLYKSDTDPMDRVPISTKDIQAQAESEGYKVSLRYDIGHKAIMMSWIHPVSLKKCLAVLDDVPKITSRTMGEWIRAIATEYRK
jgi:putative metallohydrolase (TIGR04338 family)